MRVMESAIFQNGASRNRTATTSCFLLYLAFLTLSKSGSILQQLKTLFIG